MTWKRVRKSGITEVRSYEEGEDLSGVSVQPDYKPKPGDWVARDPNNPNDRWLIAGEFYAKNYEEI